MKAVNRDIENLCKSGRATARAIAQVLTEHIRLVARSSDRKHYVSEDVLITSLPRADRVKGNFVIGKLLEDFRSVTCIRAGERIERHGGPIIVGEKAAVQALPPEDEPSHEGTFTGAKFIRVGSGVSLYILENPPVGQAWGWPGEGGPRH